MSKADYHFPIGHFSVARRSLAAVEQPQRRQRPVPRSALPSQSSHARHCSIRAAKTSADAIGIPARAQRAAAPAKDTACVMPEGILR